MCILKSKRCVILGVYSIVWGIVGYVFKTYKNLGLKTKTITYSEIVYSVNVSGWGEIK